MKKLLIFLLLTFNANAVTYGSFQNTVAAAGTEEQLANIDPVYELSCLPILATSTDYVYFGSNPVTSSTGAEVTTGGSFFEQGSVRGGTSQNDVDPKSIYIDVDTNGDGVSCFWKRL